MKKKPNRIVAPATFELPAQFVREIGRIMVRWAYFEQMVRRLVWDVLGVDDRTGRVAVRDPRLDDRIDMIGEIAFLRGIKIDPAVLKDLSKKASDALRWRDLVAHGAWIKNPNGGWLIQMTAGAYPKDHEAEHPKRRINPEGVNVSIDGLRTVTDGIEILIAAVHEIRETVEPQLRSSPTT